MECLSERLGMVSLYGFAAMYDRYTLLAAMYVSCSQSRLRRACDSWDFSECGLRFTNSEVDALACTDVSPWYGCYRILGPLALVCGYI